jgi:hypothetical protein
MMEFYTPTTEIKLFIEPYFAFKLEYAFSAISNYTKVKVRVSNKPPMFERHGKSIGELIHGQGEFNSSEEYFIDKVAKANNLILPNIDRFDI